MCKFNSHTFVISWLCTHYTYFRHVLNNNLIEHVYVDTEVIGQLAKIRQYSIRLSWTHVHVRVLLFSMLMKPMFAC